MEPVMAARGNAMNRSHDTNQYAVATRPDPKPFRLLDLPPELWLKIGKLAIDSTPLLKFDNIWRHGRSSRKRRVPAGLLQPAITQVCTSLRVELLPYYYRTRVEEGIWPLTQDSVCRFLKAIGRENRMMIGAMMLGFPGAPGDEEAWEEEKKELRRVWGVEVEIDKGEAKIEGRAAYMQHRVKFL